MKIKQEMGLAIIIAVEMDLGVDMALGMGVKMGMEMDTAMGMEMMGMERGLVGLIIKERDFFFLIRRTL
jgi:hypothetical protein